MRKLGITSFVLFALVLAAVAPAVSAAVTPGQPPGRVDSWLQGRLATADPSAALKLVVNADTIENALAAAKAAGVRPLVKMDRIGVVVGTGTPDAVRKLVTQPGVAWVGDADQPIELHLDSSHRATRAEQARGFSAPTGGGIDGRGVGIMIIDSGIQAGHPMFTNGPAGKVRRNMEAVPLFVNTAPEPIIGQEADGRGLVVDAPTKSTDDIKGHGTHVASTAAGYWATTKSGRHLVGAAPGATLYGISVATAGSTYYGALAAQFWTLVNHANPCGIPQPDCPAIRVVNNSYGPVGGGDYDPASPTVEAMDLSIDEGVTWVWSAGNNGGDGTDDATGPNPKNPKPGVLSVAAYDDGDGGNRDNVLGDFSSRGKSDDPYTWPDLAAPGVNIEAACKATFIDCVPDFIYDTEANYGRLSGTSMAAPHVAGYVALMVQANPALTPGQIENILEDTAHKFTAGAPYGAFVDTTNPDNTSSFDKGHGLVDVTAALARVLGRANPAPINYCGSVTFLTDPAGDATDFGVQGILPTQLPGKSVGSADIRYADALASGTNVRYRVRVTDLKADPAASTGDYVRYRFSTAGSHYELTLERNLNLGAAPTTDFTLYKEVVDPTTGLGDLVAVASNLPGQFNAVTNEAWTDVPLSALGTADGSQLSGVEILWQRQFGTPTTGGITLTADTAKSLCPLTV